ncbi:MAG TPA: cytochrome c oxidase subunit 3 [Candidatus Acidoferrales bacterium]|nr:cytochrome c oxidase subunit 3 [Candidatus Acidoferrales bacterium]
MAVAAAQRRPQVPETFKPAMMGMYIFLASEVMFFGSLFAMYFYMLGSHPFSWPPPAPKADFYVKWYPIPAINTVILLSSAVPAHFAQEAIAENKRARFFWLLVLTIVLGTLFELGQVYEFYQAIFVRGLTFGFNQFASAFYTMTGFHGAHVLGGLVLLALILGRGLRGQFSGRHHVAVRAVVLYWHFVDVVWIFLFTILYLGVTFGQ